MSAEAVPEVRRPRVLLLTHLFPRPGAVGVGPWVAVQADELAAACDVEVLCAGADVQDADSVRDSGVAVHHRDATPPLPVPGRAGLALASVLAWRAARRFLGSHPGRFDILHAHFAFPDAVIAARVAGDVPLVVTLHGSDVARILPRRDLAGHASRRALAGAGRVVCVSEALAAQAAAHLPPGADVRVIPMGYDATTFSVGEGPRSGVLVVGGLTDVKRPDLAFEAFARVADRVPGPLTFVGEGPWRERVAAMAQRAGLGGRVAFTGPLPPAAVAAAMRRAEAVLSTGERAGWPVVVAEALACGTPVVATDVGGTREIVRRPPAGHLVACGDVAAAAAALLALHEAPPSPHAVAEASGAPSARESADALVRLYRELAP